MIYINEHIKPRTMDAIAKLLSHSDSKVFLALWQQGLASGSCFMEGNVFSPDLYRSDVRSAELGVELFPCLAN